MANYTTLTGAKTVDGSIKQWVNDGTIPASVVLTEAEQFIYTRLRVREMKKLYTGTVSSGQTTLTLSSVAPRLLEPISFRRAAAAAGRIYIRDQQYFEERLATDTDGTLFSGIPTECCFDNTYIYFNVSTDATYYLRLWYYERPAALAGGNLTNFLTDYYPRLLRHACMMAAFDFMKEPQARDYHTKLTIAEIESANAQADVFNQALDEDLHWEHMG